MSDVESRILEFVAAPDYLPMRKRALARAMEIPEDEYRAFRGVLEEMVDAGRLAELKRGKFGLPGTRFAMGEESGDVDADVEEATPQPALSYKKGQRTGPPPGKPVPLPKGTEDQPWNKPNRLKRQEKDDGSIPKDAIVGKIEVKRGGMGFVITEGLGGDIFVPQEELGGAISGDKVAVVVQRRPERRGRFGKGGGASHARPVGRVVKIMERGRETLVGTFHAYSAKYQQGRDGPAGFIVPDTRGVFSELEVLKADIGDAKTGDKVAITLRETHDSNRSGQTPTAKIVRVFGPAGDADADIEAILNNFNVQREFPPEVLAYADAIPPEIPEEELDKRVDYTTPVTFTIDPSDAKDHDDAVALTRDADGRTVLLVHIADVAHYVPEDSVLDLEARARATSVYLPGRVYPMLPPRISNDLCSLKEGKLRLTKTVRITYGHNMQPLDVRIERSYIRSAAFLTYDMVRDAVDNEKPEIARTPEIYQKLIEMKAFSQALRKKRFDSGSLNLDLPETKLLLNEAGEVTGFTKVEHHWAHELIEEMMLAANRAVAEYTFQHEIPNFYRTHDEPDEDALERFAEFANACNIPFRPPFDRLRIKSVLERVRGTELEYTIHLALLTSLKQARYTVDCAPHFALNFTRYLHFTSPIRRYPDTITHRALDRFAPEGKTMPVGRERKKSGDLGKQHYARITFLRPLAAHCSQKEREADQCEKEVKKFRQMEFLRRNMKEAHPAIITGVRDFGLFIELQDCLVEGMVRIQDLSDDWYEYFEGKHLLQGRRTKRSFRLGDKVEVRVADIDLGRKQVMLEII